MRTPRLLASLRARVRRPGTWVAVATAGLLWNLLRLGAAPGSWTGSDLLSAGLIGIVLVLASPVPWQWTGDGQSLSPFRRGLLQSLVINLAAVWMVWALLPPVGMAMGPERMGGGGMMGRGMMGRGMMGRRGMMMAETAWGPFLLNPMQARLGILALATLLTGVLLGRALAGQEGERIRAEEAERAGREAQSRALQAQMNPHILFNTISGLAELSHAESPRTETALVSLAELLRRLLAHADRTAAPLAQEREIVERLLELERFRLGDRLQVDWAWDGSLEALLAPPLLLQPLVENAIKHGIAPDRAGGRLEIGLAGSKGFLHLWVANTGRPFREGSPEGTGLSNLRKRLALMEGTPGKLQVRAEGGRTLAEVWIRLEEAGHA